MKKVYYEKFSLFLILILLTFSLCKTGQRKENLITNGEQKGDLFAKEDQNEDHLTPEEKKEREAILNSNFFQKEPKNEAFRVFLSSDFYIFKQYGYEKWISRKLDPGGDQFIQKSLNKMNKINEEREGVVKVTLYPGAGTISKIRPIKLTFLEELDRIMVEDMQRWKFNFPKKVVRPTHFHIRFRFKLMDDLVKEKTLAELEKEYLEKNPKFYKYLLREQKKREKMENH